MSTHRRAVPRLVALVVACLLPLTLTTQTPAVAGERRTTAAGATTQPAKATVALKPALRKVLKLVNAARARHDKRPLKITACLTKKVAQPWAVHLAATQQLVHRDLSQVFTICPGLSRVGENIAYGYPTAAAVMKAWMHSPGHRANILNGRFTKIGLGLARASDGTPYWVQNFGA